MRRILLLLSSLFLAGNLSGESFAYPLKWNTLTSDRYIYAIEEDENTEGVSQPVFLNELLNRARLNVARQLNVSVSEQATLVKDAVAGMTRVSYASVATFSTTASLQLLRTETDYQNGMGAAIAYLDKSELCAYWSDEANRILTEQELKTDKARRMMALGYKKKAKAALEELRTEFRKIDEPLVWLGLCSCPQEQYQSLLDRWRDNVRQTEEALLSLGHGITVFLDCNADVFASQYPALERQLAANLSSPDRSFVDNPVDADWIVRLTAKAREARKTTLGDNAVYFSYVDVSLEIIKGSTAQTVYQDAFSEKGADTRGFREAALEVFKKLPARLSASIEKNVKE